MAEIKAVILDWAGTAVDFGCFAPVQAFMDAFQAAGIEPTLEEVRKPMGMLKREHVKTMLSMKRISGLWEKKYDRPWTEEDVDKIYEKSEKGILEIVGNFASPKPYVLKTVEELRGRGIKIGSTTGYTDEMMNIVVPKAKEQGYEPDAWFSPDAVERFGRPYPYMIYKNMQALLIKSVQQVIKVGDTVSDIEEGKNAGVISVGVLEGSSVMGLSCEELKALIPKDYEKACKKAKKVYQEAGADYVITNMKELLPLIDKLEKQ